MRPLALGVCVMLGVEFVGAGTQLAAGASACRPMHGCVCSGEEGPPP